MAFAFLCGIAGFRAGWRAGNRFLLPVLQGLFGWVAFLLAWTIVGPRWAAAAVGAWALGTTGASLATFVGRPAETDARVLRSAGYRATMLAWLETGRGPEDAPLATARQHVRELIWYLAAAIVTGNLASLVMGAVLLNYMNAYVATLLRAARRRALVIALAWNPWSVVRVAAYVMIGAAAATPVVSWWGLPGNRDAARWLAVAGAIGVVLDLVLKLTLSRWWGRRLAPAVDLEAAKANYSP